MAENKGILPSSTFNTLGNNSNKWEAVYANKLVGPAVTDSAPGLMTAVQKKKLDKLSNYSLPVASATTLGGVKIGGGLTITNGVVSSSVTGGNATHGKKLFTTNGTFVVPEGVSILVVTAVGGGGGGGGGYTGTASGILSSRTGVHGEACDFMTLNVIPLSSHQIYVGTGGRGGHAGICNGTNAGGAGGVGIANGANGGSGINGSGGGGGGGGASGIDTTVLARGGSGGEGGGTVGGNSGTGGTLTSVVSYVNTSKCVSPSYGAPGATGSNSSNNGTGGGNGASGCVYIIW